MGELRGEAVVLRPLAAEHAAALAAILATAEVGRWWGPVPDGFPLDDDLDVTRFAILEGDEVAGLVQYSEENEPDYRHATVDVFVDPPRHGRGIGRDALATIVRHLVGDRGHHRVTIDPAADNIAAIHCYERVGFRRVGILEAAWRDQASGSWLDALLMELVDREAAGRTSASR